MLLFLNYRNINANLIAESKTLSQRFQDRHRSLEDYITEVNTIFYMCITLFIQITEITGSISQLVVQSDNRR
jgi:hypothetical protein